MKKFIAILLVLLCTFAMFAEDATNIDEVVNKFSYYLGARSLYEFAATYGLAADADAFIKGATDLVSGAYNMTSEEVQSVVNSYNEYYNELLKVHNLEFANEFLASNASQKGVVTTKTGLQYRIDERGTGVKPSASDTVVCYYTLVLPDGTVLDRHDESTGPAELPLSNVIDGFKEVCMAVPVGSTVTAWIHPDLGYKETGIPGYIGPNSMLLYQIQILSVK